MRFLDCQNLSNFLLAKHKFVVGNTTDLRETYKKKLGEFMLPLSTLFITKVDQKRLKSA